MSKTVICMLQFIRFSYEKQKTPQLKIKNCGFKLVLLGLLIF